MGIEWYPIVSPERDVFEKKDWIHPIHTQELIVGKEACFRKINDFLDTQTIVDNDYYGFIDDDSMYEPGFFDIIRQQTSKIIICSLYRGDSIPNDNVAKHPTYPLIIKSLRDIYVCNIGLPQYIIKGEIFKQTRFNPINVHGDGKYAEYLKFRFSKDITILSDLFAFGNYFQPGRYTNAKKFLKPSWNLPVVII
jgi:hypothetical protein